MIYEELLLPSSKPCYSQGTSVANLLPDHSTYYSADTNSSPFDLAVRSVDPYLGAYVSCGWRRRSRYHIRTGMSNCTIYLFIYIRYRLQSLTQEIINRSLSDLHNTNNLSRITQPLHSAPTTHRTEPPPSEPPDPRRSSKSPLLDVHIPLRREHRSRSAVSQRPDTNSSELCAPYTVDEESAAVYEGL
jgi:hypothetical protein